MALKATVFKAALQLADMDRNVYADYALTLARHPSETDERLMVRVLAFALNTPASDQEGGLGPAKGLSDTDEPDLWQRDLTGRIVHWIELGQPDEKRMLKACGKADHVSIYAYAPSVAIWWGGVANKLARARNLAVWQLESAATQSLASLAQRSMRLQATVQDGTIWLGDGERAVELTPHRLNAAG